MISLHFSLSEPGDDMVRPLVHDMVRPVVHGLVHDRITTNGCEDCGAPADAECSPTCPSAMALFVADELDAEANTETPCCPDPVVAARRLCGCWGGGAGAWIGSAA